MIRVAILHPDLSASRRLQFELRSAQEFQVVHITHERQRLLEALRPLKIDCVLVATAFDGGETFPVCQEVQVYAPEVGCVAYGPAADVARGKRMLFRGAGGFVLEEDGPELLHEALRHVGDGGTYISSDAAFHLLGLRHAGDAADRHLRPSLSKREKDVMRAILEERTTGEIAELLKISFGTVETHRRNMLQKVGARNTAGLVRSCYELSLLE